MSRDFPTRIIAFSALGALAIAGLTGAPAIAAKKAAPPSYVAAANGVIGVTQSVLVNAPRYAGKSVSMTASQTGSPSVPLTVTLDASGIGSASWLPTAAGTWSVQGTGPFAIATGSAVSIAAVPTITTLFVPAQAQAGTSTTLSATVQSVAGALIPQGTVTFRTVYGTTLGTATLGTAGSALSGATLAWTPTAPDYVPIVATYNPANGSGGSANTVGSSDQGLVQVLSTQPNLVLRMPADVRLGRATTITGVLNLTGQSGSMAFDLNVNGTASSISGSVTLPASNEVSVPWTPATVGNQVVSASWSSSSNNASASSSQAVQVLPARVPDPISAGPSGQGSWPTSGAITLPPKSRVLVASSTLSGSPVSLAASGSCVMIGSTLITTASSGTCGLAVTSTGSESLAPNTARYSFTIAKP